MNKYLLSVLLAAGLAFQVSGCSWTFTGRVPDGYHLSEPLQCTEYGLPVADFMNAGYLAALAVLPPEDLGGNVTESMSWVVLGAYSTVGLLFLISGLTGIFWSANCHDTYFAHREFLSEEKFRVVIEKKEPPEKNLPPIPGIKMKLDPGTGEKVVEISETEEKKKPKKVTKKRRPRRRRKKRRTIRRKRRKKRKKKKKKKRKKKTRKGTKR